MIKHTISWKLYPEAEGFSKEENKLRIKTELEKLKTSIKQIKSLEIGLNESKSQFAFDIIMIMLFDNWEDLQIYQTHTKHIELKEFLQPLRSDRVIVDYQLSEINAKG